MNHADTMPLRQTVPVESLAPEAGGSPESIIGVYLWALFAVIMFHAVYALPQLGFLVVLYLFALVRLCGAGTWRRAFYSGLAVGVAIGAFQLAFFWRIFSAGAIALWLVYAFWIGLFVAMGRECLRKLVPLGWLALPIVWCGLEYFRSELYYLRFSWLSPGMAFGVTPNQVPLHQVGVYGISFLLMCIACGGAYLWQRSKRNAVVALAAGTAGLYLWASLGHPVEPSPIQVQIAGVQMEFPTENEVLVRLNELIHKHPQAQLIVLSEYTFGEEVPERILKWCREKSKYLVVGGKERVLAGNFYNTAFVVSPEGRIIFRQVKSVPIQFFKDGLPAPEQQVWSSPWGKIGICICYDLSYRRVTDRLVELGAQALIVPTMDVADWGLHQHELHARIAPLRAAEYGIPVFRLASSGISQAVDGRGHVLDSAPSMGDGAMLATALDIGVSGRRPFDRWLAPSTTKVTGLLGLLFFIKSLRGWASSKGQRREVCGTGNRESKEMIHVQGDALKL
jgi:apolipoprotein N-acyltransferase